MQFRSGAAFLLTFLAFSLPMAYADDASEGRNLFLRKCLGCHAFACNKECPKLGGLIGRKAASVEDYDGYSQSLRSSGIVWSDQTLDRWFMDPGRIAPESVMVSNGKLDDAVERRQIIAFLKTEDPSVNICPQE